MTRRILAVLVAVMLIMAALPALAETTATDWREPYAEPIDIHIAAAEQTNAIFAEGEDMFNNLWTKRWKELYNVNVIVDWVSIDYETKLNLAIASNTLPDAFPCNAVQFNQLKTAGYLADITSAYETYGSDTLKGEMEKNWDIVETAMDGDKLLAIPQFHYGYECNTSQLWARNDWMQEAGLTGFETVEDLENTMKLFKETYNAQYGIMLDKSLDGLFRTAPMFHAASSIWIELEDGTLGYGNVQPEMKDALAAWAKWYQEGYVRPDFGTLDNAAMLEDAYNGNVGIYPGPNHAGWSVGKDVVANQGEGSYFIAYDVPSVDGEKVMWPIPFCNYDYDVVNVNYEHPEILIKLVNDYAYVLNDSLSEGSMTLEEVLPFNTGDMHHVTGPFKIQFASYTDCMDVYNAFKTGEESFHTGYGQIYYNEAKLWETEGLDSSLGRWLQMAIDNGGMVIGCKHVDNGQILKDAMWGLKPQAVLDYGTTLDDLLIEGFTQIIMGVESIDYFDVLVENWRMAGGDQVTQAVNEMYGNK